MNVVESIKKHEGWRATPYQDSEGIWTVGYGFNLETLQMPKPVGELWLAILIHKCEDELQQYHWYNRLDSVRQDAILDMYYNLGGSRFSEFKKMISALENQKYDTAAREALDSKWATQVGDRADEIAHALRTGRWLTDENQNENE